MKEVPKGVFNFCLQEDIRKQISRNAETDIFFEGIDSGEMGVVDLLIEVFKIRSKIWWLQKDKHTIERTTLHGVQMEDDTIRNPTACEEMEHCHNAQNAIIN